MINILFLRLERSQMHGNKQSFSTGTFLMVLTEPKIPFPFLSASWKIFSFLLLAPIKKMADCELIDMSIKLGSQWISEGLAIGFDKHSTFIWIFPVSNRAWSLLRKTCSHKAFDSPVSRVMEASKKLSHFSSFLLNPWSLYPSLSLSPFIMGAVTKL